MSNVHIRFIEDTAGDLVDLEYFHHEHAPADVLGWPAPESVDYPVHCTACGERVHEVPLTEQGRREYGAVCAWLSIDGYGCNFRAGHVGWHERHRAPGIPAPDLYR